MRQAGFKPKGHNSGVYWVRASAEQGGGKKKEKVSLEGDVNGDGVVDKWDRIESNTILFCKIGGLFLGIFICILALIF
jgi:hypothetical protein